MVNLVKEAPYVDWSHIEDRLKLYWEMVVVWHGVGEWMHTCARVISTYWNKSLHDFDITIMRKDNLIISPCSTWGCDADIHAFPIRMKVKSRWNGISDHLLAIVIQPSRSQSSWESNPTQKSSYPGTLAVSHRSKNMKTIVTFMSERSILW